MRAAYYKIKTKEITVYVIPIAKLVVRDCNGNDMLFHSMGTRSRRDFNSFVRQVLQTKNLSTASIMRIAEKWGVHWFTSFTARMTIRELEDAKRFKVVEPTVWHRKRKRTSEVHHIQSMENFNTSLNTAASGLENMTHAIAEGVRIGMAR